MSDAIHMPKIADVIADHIGKMIFDGVLRPGEKLASERDLAEKLEVSRPSLREAIEKLNARGLLITTRGGTCVSDFLAPLMQPLASLLKDNPQATDDYFEFRRILEGQAARFAALRASEADKAAIRACIDQMTTAHALEDPTQEADSDADLHLLIYEATHNVIFLHVMRAMVELLRQGIFYNRQQLYLRAGARQMLLSQHVAIANAVITGKPDEAEAEAKEHIRFTSETILDIRRDQSRLESSLSRGGRDAFLAQ